LSLSTQGRFNCFHILSTTSPESRHIFILSFNLTFIIFISDHHKSSFISFWLALFWFDRYIHANKTSQKFDTAACHVDTWGSQRQNPLFIRNQNYLSF
jgi:hypothetical protein